MGISNKRLLTYFAIFIIILFSVFVRARLLDIPLERDEAEYAFSARYLIEGIPLYTESYELLKPPGAYVSYALFLMLFGDDVTGIHLGLMFVNTLSILLIFIIGRRLFDTTAGLVACVSFAMMSLSQRVLGFVTNSEPILLLPALIGILLLLEAKAREHLILFFLSGFFLGTAFIIKQPAITFITFSGLYLIYTYSKEERRPPIRYLKELSLFTFGAVFPFITVCLLLWSAGVFEKFYFWTFKYALVHGSIIPIDKAFFMFRTSIMNILNSAIIIWLLALFGLTSLLWDNKTKEKAFFVSTFFIFSFFATSFGLYFRAHYFILLLPAVSLLAGLGVSSASRLFAGGGSYRFLKVGVPVLLTLIAISFLVYNERFYLFTYKPDVISRKTYGRNPFIESIEIAKYLKEHTTKDERIAVIGSEPEIYFYADRRAATKYPVIYTLTAEHEYALSMQEEFISQIESERPRYLLYVNIPTSWIVKPKTEMMIFDWAEKYITENYNRVGFVDIRYPEPSEFYWDEEVLNHSPQSNNWIYVFKRKG